MAHVLLPMLFAALRAILSAIPQANNLPEICCAIQRISTTTAVGSKERRHVPYDRQRVLRHMSAADSAQRSDVPQQATNVLKPATLVINAAANGSAPSANMDDAGESEAKKLRVDEDKAST
ncbi:hypothetical protein HPB50_002772 [Hyalomma asiaticum]|uniref:Uncharacterized protein n=1 Tax=Hyalomma asiaticum TaxID=266040 RepID=A0ACB7S6N8_HYAAI|nr:hypothetical protein HPB50_002772 [Hyalomma asiaticum]